MKFKSKNAHFEEQMLAKVTICLKGSTAQAKLVQISKVRSVLESQDPGMFPNESLCRGRNPCRMMRRLDKKPVKKVKGNQSRRTEARKTSMNTMRIFDLHFIPFSQF